MIIDGHSQSAVRETLTEKEINDCLSQAFKALSVEDQENVLNAAKRLTGIPKVGIKSALQILFATDQAPALARLHETLKGG